MMRYLNSTILCTAMAGLLVACSPDPGSETDGVTEAEMAEGITTPSTDAMDDAQSQGEQTPSSITVTRAGNADGRTLVLIPGLASSDAVWDGTVDAFGDYDLRVVQVAGFAGAEPVENISAEKISDDISNHLRETPGNNTVLIGHSLGGFVALKAGLDHAGQLDELIIVDSLPYLAGLYMPEATPEQAASMSAQMTQQLASLPRAQFDVQQQAGLARLSNNAEAMPQLTEWGKSSDQQTVAIMMGELMGTDMRNAMSDLSLETTVLIPHSQVMGVSLDELENLYAAQYENAPNVTLKVIEDSFHFIMLDQPEAFYAAVKEEVAE